ncbi:MAG: YgiT-type zinc finger protein [Nitrospinae bacterium]|nr:YgiT-type zinc finger protein [Nitrospinota bacterium]
MKKDKPCPECHTIMEIKKTTLHFEREGFYADVENVSAYICPKCGARTIPGNIAINIGNTIEILFKSARESEVATEDEFAPAFSGISFHKITA